MYKHMGTNEKVKEGTHTQSSLISLDIESDWVGPVSSKSIQLFTEKLQANSLS